MSRNRTQYKDWRLEGDYQNLTKDQQEYLRAFNRIFFLASRNPKDIAVIKKYSPDFDFDEHQKEIDAQKYAQRNDCMNVSTKKARDHERPRTATGSYFEFTDSKKLIDKDYS